MLRKIFISLLIVLSVSWIIITGYFLISQISMVVHPLFYGILTLASAFMASMYGANLILNSKEKSE